MAKRQQDRETQTITPAEVGSVESVLPEVTATFETPEEVKLEKVQPEPEVIAAPPEPEPLAAPPVPPPTARYGPSCGVCGSTAVGIAGGMHHCNQCSHSW